MEYTDNVPLEYAEFALARETGWNVDAMPAHRVDEALAFMGLEAKHKKMREKTKGPQN